MTVALVCSTLFMLFALAMAVRQATSRPLVRRELPLPQTFGEWQASELPLWVADMQLSATDPNTVAHVYNHSAALLRLGWNVRATP